MSPLYDRYAAALLGLALRITREQADAEEVVVDTFAQAWRDASSFQPGRGSVAAWLATIARSRALDLLRSRARRGRLGDAAADQADLEPAGMGGGFASPVAGVLSDERTRLVQQALARLPDAQRTTLELAYFQGLSQAEIAERLQEPLGTVKTRMRLGLRKLRELLAPLGPGGST
jgi:RNA polymerase sigma-70 factor (ECF subfamily)